MGRSWGHGGARTGHPAPPCVAGFARTGNGRQTLRHRRHHNPRLATSRPPAKPGPAAKPLPIKWALLLPPSGNDARARRAC